jgi:hypothetical protein
MSAICNINFKKAKNAENEVPIGGGEDERGQKNRPHRVRQRESNLVRHLNHLLQAFDLVGRQTGYFSNFAGR